MFTIYVDDSGTSPSQSVALAAGLIIPASQIESLDAEWEIFLKREGFNDFHAAKCAYRNYKSQFAKWEMKKVKRVIRRVREITKKYSVKAYSFAIRKCDYDEIITDELRATGGLYHYTWAIRHLISAVDMSTDKVNISVPVEYVFDWMDEGSPSRKEVETVMAQAESIRPGRYKGHYSFRRREEIPGLQCADMLAWSCYKFAIFVYDKIPLTEIGETSFWDFENFQDGEWMSAVAQKREDLKIWVQNEINDPRSQERRRQWILNNPKFK